MTVRHGKAQNDWLVVLLPFFALVAPLIIWSLQMFFGSGIIIEEIVKLIFVLLMRRKPSKATSAVLIGMLYGLSESALYLMNISMLGSSVSLWLRLILTMPMHGLTTLIIYRSTEYGWVGTSFGVLLSLFVHKMFNEITMNIY